MSTTTATISSSAAAFTSSQATSAENSPLSNTIKKINEALETNPSLHLEKISDYKYTVIGSASFSRNNLQEMLCKDDFMEILVDVKMERTKEGNLQLELLPDIKKACIIS